MRLTLIVSPAPRLPSKPLPGAFRTVALLAQIPWTAEPYVGLTGAASGPAVTSAAAGTTARAAVRTVVARRLRNTVISWGMAGGWELAQERGRPPRCHGPSIAVGALPLIA